MWTRDNVEAHRPSIPVVLEGHPLITEGIIVPDRNNAWVVVDAAGVFYEVEMSWEAVLQSLNQKDIRIPVPIERPRRRWSTPVL